MLCAYHSRCSEKKKRKRPQLHRLPCDSQTDKWLAMSRPRPLIGFYWSCISSVAYRGRIPGRWPSCRPKSRSVWNLRVFGTVIHQSQPQEASMLFKSRVCGPEFFVSDQRTGSTCCRTVWGQILCVARPRLTHLPFLDFPERKILSCVGTWQVH